MKHALVPAWKYSIKNVAHNICNKPMSTGCLTRAPIYLKGEFLCSAIISFSWGPCPLLPFLHPDFNKPFVSHANQDDCNQNNGYLASLGKCDYTVYSKCGSWTFWYGISDSGKYCLLRSCEHSSIFPPSDHPNTIFHSVSSTFAVF